MKHTGLRLLSVVTAMLCVPCFLPSHRSFSCTALSVEAASTTTDAPSYTDSTLLCQRVDAICAGDCNLYLDTDGTPSSTTLSLGAALNNDTMYYAFTETGFVTGWQCYIYAQGVYAKLFGEAPYHGAAKTTYRHSNQVMGQAPEASNFLFRTAQVMPGAYLRTTVNPDGTFDGSAGHSLIVLGHSESSITVLEGNADGRGLIRKAMLSWEQFNRAYLSGRGRYVSHIVQPMASYYKSEYGLSYDFSTANCPATFTMRRSGQTYRLFASDQTVWQSDNPAVASVDAEGVVTAHKNGTVTVTAQSGSGTKSFLLTVAIVPWDTLGDVNASGTTDSEDAVLVLQQYVGRLSGDKDYLTDAQQVLGDIDNDGRITSVDAEWILRFYLCSLVGEAKDGREALWARLLCD